jgi:hypothetical protein
MKRSAQLHGGVMDSPQTGLAGEEIKKTSGCV